MTKLSFVPIAAIVAGVLVATVITLTYAAVGNGAQNGETEKDMPVLRDEHLGVEMVASGLQFPTSMAFLDPDNILVTQKNDGKLRLLSGGKLQENPVLEVDVAEGAEQGMLGIAISGDSEEKKVFLYLTEHVIDEGDDTNVTRNRVYSYDYEPNGKTLVNQKLVLDLPGEPGPFHNGGKIAIGPQDGHLYAVIGDVNEGGGKLDNTNDGREPDDHSVIFRVDRETGLPVEDNPFYHFKNTTRENMTRYYAYGIRNAFGMDFDPVSNTLWMTENGPDTYDEINVVRPGFNSGWHKIIGPIDRSNATADDLVMFEGATYNDPVFSWYYPVGVTDIEFYNSDKLGQRYQNNIFVGDINNGNLYFFKLSEDRMSLSFDSSQSELMDRVADPASQGSDLGINAELSSIIIGERFGRITDIETGPDGYLYVLTYMDGKIFRIVPK